MRTHDGWNELLERRPLDVVVETGTYRAVNTVVMSKVFKEVHSIELSPELYANAVETCKDLDNVHLHHGDSSIVIPTLEFDESVYYFLDAHWCLTKPAVTANGAFPLWKELDFIAQRPYSDVIMVDDVYAFENKSREAKDPRYNNDWDAVNKDTILAAVERHKPVLESFEFHDVFVMYV